MEARQRRQLVKHKSKSRPKDKLEFLSVGLATRKGVRAVALVTLVVQVVTCLLARAGAMRSGRPRKKHEQCLTELKTK